jgi:GT2 family glycosyltransferase
VRYDRFAHPDDDGAATVSGRVEVSCVVVCYHRHDSLRIMAASLADPRIELVVVNAEVDPEIAAIAEAAGAVHVPLHGDPGYATAVNLGARHVSSDFVIFMNDDLHVSSDTVFALREAVADGEGDVVVPAVFDSEGLPEATIKAKPTPVALAREVLLLPDRPISVLRGRIHVEKWREPQGPEEIDACGAPIIACRTALLVEQPMPEDYFLYWDEIEWFWHLRESGRRVVYRPDLRVRHIGGRRDVSAMKSRLITRNAVRCVRRTQGLAAGAAAFWIMLAYNIRLLLTASLRVILRRPAARHELSARLAGLMETPASFRELFGARPT